MGPGSCARADPRLDPIGFCSYVNQRCGSYTTPPSGKQPCANAGSISAMPLRCSPGARSHASIPGRITGCSCSVNQHPLSVLQRVPSDILQKLTPDLLIDDVMLPGGNGDSLASLAR